MTTDDDHMTTADVMSADEIHEDDQRAQFAADAADDTRNTEPAAEAEAPDGDECHAELIDGSYTYCGCEDCDERATREGEDTPW